MNPTGSGKPIRSARDTRAENGLRLLKELLREALRVERFRAELDGDRSDHLEQFIEDLRKHIELVERGSAPPDTNQFRRWLDSVRSLPAGSPYRWRLASRLPTDPLRPLASTTRASTADVTSPGPEEIVDETA